MRIIPRIIRAAKRIGSRDAWSLAILAALLVVLELDGRSTRTDSEDAVRISCALAVGLLLVLRHRRRKLAWVSALQRKGARVLQMASRLQVEIGIDFRLDPPIASETPLLFRRGMLIGLVCAVSSAALARFSPEAARQAIVPISYTLWLALLFSLWSLLVFGTVLFLGIPLAAIHDHLVQRYQGREPRSLRREWLAHGGFLTALVLLAVTLPPWVPLAGIAFSFAASLAASLPSRAPPLTLLWRRAGGPLRSLSWSRVLSLQLAFAGLVAVSLILLSRGDRLFFGIDGSSMTITPGLGLLFAWASAAGLVALAIHASAATLHRRRFERANERPEPVFFVGAGAVVSPAVRRELAAAGFGVRSWATRPVPPGFLALRVDASSPAPELDSLWLRWPLALPPGSLADPGLPALLRRRVRTLRRRQLYKGLRRAFKGARRKGRLPGEGFWVAPQFWFVNGLSRDRDDRGAEFDPRRDTIFDDRVGPPFTRVVPWRARAWFFRLCRDLEVDLFFVEDGVAPRRFERVLDALLEVHDIFGGQERVEERHFRGIPGVRVVIHDFRLGRPFRSRTYPEPDYEDIARARVVHVFKDRGDAFARADSPRDVQDIPVPGGAPGASGWFF